MSATISQRPYAFSPVNNPVVYKFQKDGYAIFFTGGPDDVLVSITGDITADVSVGDSAWYISDNGVYNNGGKVVSISYVGPETAVLTDIPYISAATAGNIVFMKPLYRLSIGVYKESDDSLIGSMSKSPTPQGAILADVSSILKTLLYRDWDLTTLDEDQIGSIGFYIKHQEFYTGSSTSPVDDVAEPRVAVIASLQIRSNADLDAYVPEDTTKKFLTKFDTPSLWRGYPFTISFISPAALTGLLLYYEEYDVGNNLITSKVLEVDGDDVLSRAEIEPSSDETVKILATLNNGGLSYTMEPSAWTDGANAFGAKNDTQFTKTNAAAGTTYSAYQVVDIPNGETPSSIASLLRWTKDNPVSGTTFDVYIKFYDALGGTLVGTSHAGPYTTSVNDLPFLFAFSALTGDATIMEVSFVVFGGSADDVVLTIQPNQFVYTSIADNVSETKTILVKDPCDNPVYLFWKNSLGGDAFWLFDGSQDYNIATDERKAKQLTFFAENISINEFETINEVNTVGSVYRNNIQELTDDVIKTSSRSDQQLYVIDEEGNKTGVINLNRNNSTQTKQVKHFIDVQIEYPELFL